jgi:hypothetical protein
MSDDEAKPDDNAGAPAGWLLSFKELIANPRRRRMTPGSKEIEHFRDLVDGRDYSIVMGELMLRYGAALDARDVVDKFMPTGNGKDLEIPLGARLAITDVFTEKAIVQLTRRANAYAFFGLAMLLTFVMLSVYAFHHLTQDYYSDLIYTSYPISSADGSVDKRVQVHVLWTGYTFGLELSRHLAIGGILASGLYLCFSFAKSFIEEATLLYNRRHAIRSGRLAIWLKSGDVTSEDIARFFGVAAGEKSALSSIDASVAGKTPIGGFTEAVVKAAENIGKGTKT